MSGQVGDLEPELLVDGCLHGGLGVADDVAQVAQAGDAATVRQSVFGGMAVASKIHSASLLASVQAAFVHGMDMALIVSAGIAVANIVLTLVFLPASNAPTKTVKPGTDKDGEAAETLPAITGQAAYRGRCKDPHQTAAAR